MCKDRRVYIGCSKLYLFKFKNNRYTLNIYHKLNGYKLITKKLLKSKYKTPLSLNPIIANIRAGSSEYCIISNYC